MKRRLLGNKWKASTVILFMLIVVLAPITIIWGQNLLSMREVFNKVFDRDNARLMTTTWSGPSAQATFLTETEILNKVYDTTGHYLRTSGGGGSGNVTVDGTPVAGQLAEWVDATTIKGTSAISLQVDDLDVANASRTRPNKVGTTNPATCAVGDTFVDSDAAPAVLRLCTVIDTWANVGGTGGGTVDISGTPVADQLAVWTDANTIAGTSAISVQITDLDLATATRTRPNKTGTTDPATCAVGDTFVDSDAAPAVLRLCTAVNTWGNVGSGGGIAAGDTITWTGKHTFSPTASLAAAGVSTIIGSAQTITLTGADPTTYATVDAYKLNSPTLVGTNANQTVTLGSTLTVVGPVKSTNVIATKVTAIDVPTWNASTAANATGLEVNAPSGATVNYAANFVGGPTLFADGVIGAPGIAFGTDIQLGIYRSASRIMTFVNNGSAVASIGNIAGVTGGGIIAANVAVGAGSGTPDVILSRATGANLQMGTVASATPVAQTLSAQNGVGTDIAGALMTIRGSLGTGNAKPGAIALSTGLASATSGTTAQTAVQRQIIGGFKVLTNNSAIALVNATVATETAVGGIIEYTIEVTNGTDMQADSGSVYYTAVNKGGTVTATITNPNGETSGTNFIQALSSGTLAVTWAISAATPAVISINANSSLTPSTGYPRITYRVFNGGQQAIAMQ